ncbi:hypothetical protein E0H75_42090 [Kribbella capetownensis]|uniref:Uncharacterized protein n=1 Tax=Kribbella capetownensis TaxID=1572659 RepID=A0A4R0IK36_9ACTN|nr:hypothetical protein [Kribbella capetownensis]TCC33853.1 hypothetical protein E0H75_42090 [Kribbella capetownensis]
MTTNTTDVMTSGPSHYTKVCELLADIEQLRTERKACRRGTRQYLALSDEIALVDGLIRHHRSLMHQAYQVLADLRSPINKLPLAPENSERLEALTGTWLQAVQ